MHRKYTARTKLKESALIGCLVIAAIVGVLCQSWFIFLLCAAILLFMNVSAGRIRLGGGSRRP